MREREMDEEGESCRCISIEFLQQIVSKPEGAQVKKYLKMHKNKIFIERASKATRKRGDRRYRKNIEKEKQNSLMRFEVASSPSPKTVLVHSQVFNHFLFD